MQRSNFYTFQLGSYHAKQRIHKEKVNRCVFHISKTYSQSWWPKGVTNVSKEGIKNLFVFRLQATSVFYRLHDSCVAERVSVLGELLFTCILIAWPISSSTVPNFKACDCMLYNIPWCCDADISIKRRGAGTQRERYLTPSR